MTTRPLRPGVTAGIAALAVAACLALPAYGQSTRTGEPAEQPSAQAAQPGETPPGEDAAETPPQSEAGYVLGDVVLGDPAAPLTVVEYASLTCPHCAAFHAETFPEFRQEYIDTGKVRFVLREVYFDQYGLWASMVARCGGEEGFYPLVDAFLGSQATWTRAQDIGHAIQQVGRRAGLPADRLQQCLSDRDFAKGLLAWYQDNRDADGIQSTPTFVIEGEKHTGAMSFEEFSAILDAALAS
jgi:protein-disulfide isomerase